MNIYHIRYSSERLLAYHNFVAIVLFFSFYTTYGQRETDFVREFLPIWDSQEFLTIRVAKAMPDSLYSFRPTPEMRSFAEQMGHIAHTIDWMFEHVVLQRKSGKTRPLDVTDMSKDEIVEYLRSAFQRGRTNIRSLSENDLELTVPFFDSGHLTKKFGVLSIHDHITNHKAKANLYIRLCGLVPPRSTYLTNGRLAK